MSESVSELQTRICGAVEAAFDKVLLNHIPHPVLLYPPRMLMIR